MFPYCSIVSQRHNQYRADEMAFPVKVKFRLEDRLGLDAMEWLNAKVGTGRYAIHRVSTRTSEATAIFFRNLAHASQFAAAFPALTLADDTLASGDEWTIHRATKQMIIEAAQEIRKRIDRTLENPRADHVILSRDEAVMTKGLLNKLHQLLEHEAERVKQESRIPVPGPLSTQGQGSTRLTSP